MNSHFFTFLKRILSFRHKTYFRNIVRTIKDPISNLQRTFFKKNYIKKFTEIQINKKSGISKYTIKSIPFNSSSFNKLIDLAQIRINNLDIDYLENSDGCKSWFPQLLTEDDLLNPKYKFILEAALSPDLISGISRYTGWIPKLNFINLLYGRTSSYSNYVNTQLPHRDGGDSNHFHVFIYLKDIESGDGATKILPKKYSSFYASNYDTKEIVQVPKNIEDKFITLNGKKGDVFLFDASSCPHYGGRSKNEGKRILLQFHYVRFAPFSLSHLNGKYKNLDITQNNNISNLALKQICKLKVQKLAIK